MSATAFRPPSIWHKALFAFCLWLCKRLGARQAGLLFERLQISLAGHDPRVGAYALEFNNPQALCFLIDAYPTLQHIFSTYPRMGTLTLLDIGPAFGAAGGLLSQMHRSHFLGPKVEVNALDIVGSRREFIELTYPLVDFLHARIEDLPEDAMWDVVYCSNTIEHIDDPREFIRTVLKHTRGFAVFLAPYREALPLSLDHRLQIDERTFEGFNVERMRVIRSAAWPATADGVEREQILAVLKADVLQ
ncbi:class I SAM-dependent methyltransferase [Limnohabitans radicicola]|uniref:Methyltransferase domain-containing protein n=1 Tax=Limnohabitans radicicola TaxID=2771427 RepID=A0A927FE40_9BURK|nr:methyltransferase domain-containing protein [Limnohabitans radicicola]MBD8049719.1 methyltransferase domain-containing protein [Limnohabitans radicicola]